MCCKDFKDSQVGSSALSTAENLVLSCKFKDFISCNDEAQVTQTGSDYHSSHQIIIIFNVVHIIIIMRQEGYESYTKFMIIKVKFKLRHFVTGYDLLPQFSEENNGTTCTDHFKTKVALLRTKDDNMLDRTSKNETKIFQN